MKNTKINKSLIDLAGVCEYFGYSESTVRRKIRDSREGKNNFPRPLFGHGARIVFLREDIENFRGFDVDEVTYPTASITPSLPIQTQSLAKTRQELKALGVSIPDTVDQS